MSPFLPEEAQLGVVMEPEEEKGHWVSAVGSRFCLFLKALEPTTGMGGQAGAFLTLFHQSFIEEPWDRYLSCCEPDQFIECMGSTFRADLKGWIDQKSWRHHHLKGCASFESRSPAHQASR